MSRGKILLIVIPAAMAMGIVIALLFLSNLGGGKDDVVPSSSVAAASSSYWTGATAGSTPLVPSSSPAAAVSVPQPEAASSVPAAPSNPLPTNIPTPPGFAQAPTIEVNGSTVTVTFKTTASSTVNSILATSGEEISVGSFYDYFNRNAEFAAAVEKRANFKAGPEGVTETFELPDTTKSYWLLINTVDNETGAWQPTVTAVPVFVA